MDESGDEADDEGGDESDVTNLKDSVPQIKVNYTLFVL